jgi:hypothetical protein
MTFYCPTYRLATSKHNTSGYTKATALVHASFNPPSIAVIPTAKKSVHVMNLNQADSGVMSIFDVNIFDVRVPPFFCFGVFFWCF